MDAKAAEHGLLLLTGYTGDARNRPGVHPNIERLLAIASGGVPLSIKIIASSIL